MAPIAPDNTGRLWIDYLANTREHTMLFRFDGIEPDGTFLENVDDILTALNPFMPTDWTFLQSRTALPGSSVSVPFGFTPTAFAGVVTPFLGAAAAFVSFVGRTGGGVRSRLYALGAGLTAMGGTTGISNYRLTAVENTSVASVVSALNSSPLVAVDGLEPVWKPYANVGFNAHWQKALRS